jgi:hypothetical protein
MISLGTEVQLAADPVSVRAVFIADNEADIFVNGKLVASEKNGPEGPRARSVDLANFHSGRNSLVVVARNAGDGPNPAGFIFEAHAILANGSKTVIATNDSWKWTARLPDSQGRFSKTPRDWQPVMEAASSGVWDRFVAGLADGLEGNKSVPMVRASLVTSDLLMRALGRPNREQIVSMRPDNITTLEAIDLANGDALAGLLKRGAERLDREAAASETLVDSVFMQALGRRPTPQEKTVLVEQMGARPSRQSIEDLLWMVLLLPEFQFVR